MSQLSQFIIYIVYLFNTYFLTKYKRHFSKFQHIKEYYPRGLYVLCT